MLTPTQTLDITRALLNGSHHIEAMTGVLHAIRPAPVLIEAVSPNPATPEWHINQWAGATAIGLFENGQPVAAFMRVVDDLGTHVHLGTAGTGLYYIGPDHAQTLGADDPNTYPVSLTKSNSFKTNRHDMLSADMDPIYAVSRFLRGHGPGVKFRIAPNAPLFDTLSFMTREANGAEWTGSGLKYLCRDDVSADELQSPALKWPAIKPDGP